MCVYVCVWAQLQNEFIDFKGQSERATAKRTDGRGSSAWFVLLMMCGWLARKKPNKKKPKNSPAFSMKIPK